MTRPILLALVALAALTPRADADGMLDPSFGNGGLVITNFPIGPPVASFDGATALVLLFDGRAVAAGAVGDIDGHAMGAARYLTSGALDTTFSGDGLAIVGGCSSIGGGGGAATALLQPDERLVLIGECPGGFSLSVARLNVDGSPDPSFGTNGQVLTPIPGGVFAAGGLLQTDGKIVAVGFGPFTGGGPTALKAARYNSDGSLDPSFGTGGTLSLLLAQALVTVDVVVQPDGKLVIAGTYGPAGSHDFALVRLLPNGTLDPSFGVGGVVVSDFGAMEESSSLILLGDGRLVLGGRRASDLALVRYLPNGSLDTTFGTGGLATADSGANDTLGQLIRLPNGKLFIAGANLTSQGSAEDFLLSRFHPDGALDISFGSSGFLRQDITPGRPDGATAVAVAGPDLVLTGGFTFPAQAATDFALARYIAATPVELLAFEVE